ncbi:hypothetical protein [Dyella kyungheensis]|uniref:Mobilization protein n=1 Tax=Dyella kyungheensis TaxID=1242174 RepID=A0ABS2JLD4_9GAMM|nr:hypothetical protein [Dyella kyungheensis]MBM7119748.1 hypothetical protein [Dyella kyungheensis]
MNKEKQSAILQQKIERTAARLAELKAQAQARDARAKARNEKIARRQRTRALVLWGIALERETRFSQDAPAVVRQILEKHLTRDGERAAALLLLNQIATPEVN